MKKKSLLFLGLFCCIMIQVQAQKDKDWANFGRFKQANTADIQLPASSRQVVFMGNSITEGWFAHDSLFFKDNGYINRGISGQTTSQMLIRFRKDVLALQPKVVVILAGTNDIAGNTGFIELDDILGNLISMAELAKAHHIKPIICSVLPAFDYPWSPGKQPNVKIPELNAMIVAYCVKNKVQYLDYFKAMADDRQGLPKDLSEDGVHPTLKGNKIMEKLVRQAITKAL